MTRLAEDNRLYNDFMAVPDSMVAEILNGELITHPRPAPRHAVAASFLADELISPFSKGRGGPGGWLIVAEPELHLGADILVPDLAGWRVSNMPALPETSYFEVRPDWICEVLSPSTERYDRKEKREIYAAHNIPFLWFVDPVSKTLETFELRDGYWVLLRTFGGEDEVTAKPFDAVPFGLGSLWF